MAWLPIESTIRQSQARYYGALAEFDAIGSSEAFVEFMLEAVRDSILPFAKPADERDAMKAWALEFFKENASANINQLADRLGSSKRSAERLVAELKEDGTLLREGSVRAGRWRVAE